MSLLEFAKWIQGTDWATYVRMSAYLYPAILSAHLSGIALFAGALAQYSEPQQPEIDQSDGAHGDRKSQDVHALQNRKRQGRFVQRILESDQHGLIQAINDGHHKS